MSKFIKFTGFCPYINNQRIIEIEYHYCGDFDHPNGLVKGLGVNCTDRIKCQFKDKCPLLENAPCNVNSNN